MLHFTITCKEMNFILDEDFYSVRYKKEQCDKLALEVVKAIRKDLPSKEYEEKDFSFVYETEKNSDVFYWNVFQFSVSVLGVFNQISIVHDLENTFLPEYWYSCGSLYCELNNFLQTLEK